MSWKSYFSLFQRHETRPTPKCIYNKRIYWNAIIASWVAVIIGYDAGFIGGAVSLASFQREFGLDTMSTHDKTNTTEIIISLFQAGAFFGALGTYPVAAKFGRKLSLAVATVVLIVGSAIQLASNSSSGLGAMYAGRVLTGVGIGTVSNVAPMYAAEIAPPSIRGQLIGFYEIAWQIGGVIGFWINYATSVHYSSDDNKQWMIPVGIQILPAGVLALVLWSLVESPRWLMSVGRREKALANLCLLRKLPADDEYLQYEFDIIEQEMAQKAREVGTGIFDPVKGLLTSKSLMHRLGLSTSTFIIQNTVAVNAVNYYSPKIFQAMGIDSVESSLLSTGVFGILKGVFCLVWSVCIVDRFGRRPCLIFGLVLCSLCFWYIGAYIKVADPTARISSGNSQIDGGGRAALALFYIWTIGYALSWSGTPWVWNAEVFPTSVRNASSAVNAASNWFWAFIIARFTNQMINAMDYGIFFFFASCMTVCLPIFYLLYPETKNIPMEYMDQLFMHKPWRAHAIVMEQIKKDRMESDGLVETSITLDFKDSNEKRSETASTEIRPHQM
ncbi:sugar porter family MFS transporter [Cyberlindnera jadinii NRRL Y-1542]|uniref:Quinate transporter n=1 Tax=Cyberlindnera jadinii (strain ATCC 18201 / CBS 1600 / BCRC 20928 / JCM 3617 / NBRC 0987 / NRRL Y-1542) TaxID=983966 RepID=A0A1E4S0A6_CYBJN|nr:MFS quinate transporter QutD [Cyberlindnera jadinii NRRL Y-1542]ODV72928.1 MFS quinate transporter QutD [Cyberlindnera jadinii NRRL Y-1542]